MNVLVVGSGAREHALLWKLHQSSRVDRLFAAPGNAGTASLAENVPIAATDVDALVRLAEEQDIGLTVVGPEAPLALGLADRLRAAGRRVVGPSAAAARIEASKAFAKGVMTRAGVPTARYDVFTEPDAALRYLSGQRRYPLVIKADGLAAGKGVWVCDDEQEAREAVEAMLVSRRYGGAGHRILIEEAVSGPEISLIAFVDGARAVPMPIAQDHKRLCDGGRGPNTGGMGAYAPVPFISDVERDALTRLTIDPVVAELASMGTPFRGFLFAGLMLTERGPCVLEYNCRFGDPEAQALLPLLRGDLLPWLEAIADGALPSEPSSFAGSATGVVLAATGYPEQAVTGTPIERLEDIPANVLVFHAGTRLDESGRIVTDGGRVLTVVGLGESASEATRRAYSAPVHFEGMQRRLDIGRVPSPPHLLPRLEGGRTIPPFSPGRRGVGGTKSRIAVLASREGSNLQALIEACRQGELEAEIAAVISHRSNAGALGRAERAGISAIAIPFNAKGDPAARGRLEEELLAHLLRLDLDLIVLAGWMFILSPRFLARCPCSILNVHPALLPDGVEPLDVPVLRGAHAVREAIALGLPYTGVSIHRVTEEVDAGPVVAREVVPIQPGDDEDSLYPRMKQVEHRLLVRAVRQVLQETSVPEAINSAQGGVRA